MEKRILLVEDDRHLARSLTRELVSAGYQTEIAANAEEAVKLFVNTEWDLVLLDVNLPDESGFDMCKEIKKMNDIPIIFLTACDLEEDEALGFDLGADDYITKPFKIDILVRRIEAVLRRYEKTGMVNEVYRDGYLELIFDSCLAKRDGVEIQFTPTEFRLLSIFIKNAGKVLTRNILLSDIWDINENFVDEHALTVNINRIRKKIEDENHTYIKTVYGMGYMWMGDKG